ncbi:MAG: helix-turn-helix domain-containing protein [Patescibacteria group bacterium]
MYEQVLKDIGLTPNESKIYKSLLELKRASIWSISKHAEIHRRNTYDAIQRLIHKGLAFQVLPKKILTYAPVHPDKLREILDERVQNLENALPGLIKKYKNVVTSQSVYVYKGIGGLKNYIALELSVGKPIYGLGSKGSWFDPRIKNFVRHAVKKYSLLRLKNKIIYDASIKEFPEITRAVGGEYKFLPKELSTESSIDIFGNYVAIYSGINPKGLSDDITIFVLKDKTLAQDYIKWWNFIWNTLPTKKRP